MNDLLELKGSFEQRKNTASFGNPTIPENGIVTDAHIRELVLQLQGCLRHWEHNQEFFEGALVEGHYTSIVAKSNRIKRIFSIDKNNGARVVGARFSESGDGHIITYFMPLQEVESAISRLTELADNVRAYCGGTIHGDRLDTEIRSITGLAAVSSTSIRQMIVDSFYIREFKTKDVSITVDINAPLILSIYDVGVKIDNILAKAGIRDYVLHDDFTALVYRNGIKKLQNEVPELVAMSALDEESLNFTPTKIETLSFNNFAKIPAPTNEPTIGVFDTCFDKTVYFGDWVEYHDLTDSNIPITQADYRHGTAISSILVDGANTNPSLDDGCGRFRVRHFAVGRHNVFSVSTILREIEKVIEDNSDIHVWNLSLGSNNEIQRDCISPIAAKLDELQFKHNVVFVVAGTNKPDGSSEHYRIGSPADSINSVVVNAVNRESQPASYSREGMVLSFFNKPDVSYYGGETNDAADYIIACTGVGAIPEAGTSVAAPWIARKMAYLIDVLGFSREVAKALLIDSAAGWDDKYKQPSVARLMGFGVVPQKIQDIIKSPKDEIRFAISGTSTAYDTYNYNIPVPTVNGESPFIARATLCYFPHCDRRQGVDYSSTELDIYFGRIDDNGRIKSVNENKQSLDYGDFPGYITEENARKLYRKWDNTKHIQQYIKKKPKMKKVYSNPMWGLSVKTKERTDIKYGDDLKFGVVVTLKEINGVNRIEDFIRQCFLRGWLVNRIDIDQKIDVYNKMQEQIELE